MDGPTVFPAQSLLGQEFSTRSKVCRETGTLQRVLAMLSITHHNGKGKLRHALVRGLAQGDSAQEQ